MSVGAVTARGAAITAVGFISPAGVGRAGFRAGLGRGPWPEGLQSHDPEQRLPRRGTSFFSAATRLLCSVSLQALADDAVAGVIEGVGERVGVYHGTELPNLADDFAFDLVAKHEGPESVSPMRAPSTLANVASAQLAISRGLRGPNVAVSAGACGAGAALDLALLQIDEDIVDVALVGSVEVSSPYHAALWRAEEAFRQLPHAGDGAAAFVLERGTSARARGARVHAYVDAVEARHARTEGEIIDVVASLVGDVCARAGWGRPPEAIVVGAGAARLDPRALGQALASTLGAGDCPALVPGEAFYGRSENSGGALGSLLALELFDGSTLEPGHAVRGSLLAAWSAASREPGAASLALVLCVDDRGACNAVALRRAS